MQCRKQAHLRSRKDYEEELKEEKRRENASFKSDGLKNVSRNLLGLDFGGDNADTGPPIDWAPPTSFGLDNSVRLADAATEVLEKTGGDSRVFTTMKDIKQTTKDERKEKVRFDRIVE